jgi:hypothetical protein
MTGVYIRVGRENVLLEDLTDEQLQEVFDSWDKPSIERTCKLLLGIIREKPREEEK